MSVVAAAAIAVGIVLVFFGLLGREVARAIREGRRSVGSVKEQVDGTTHPDLSDFERSLVRRDQMMASHYAKALVAGSCRVGLGLVVLLVSL